jgi:hypothetical protein
MSSNRAPAALPKPASGDATFDGAVTVIQTQFEEDNAAVTAAFKRLNLSPKTGDDVRLAGLLVPEVLDFGGSGKWDDDVAKKMSPKERAAYRAEHDAAYGRHGTRRRYFMWLVEKLAASEIGATKLATLLASKKPDGEPRSLILKALARSNEPFVPRAMVSAFPPASWTTLDATQAPVLKLVAESFVRISRDTAFDALRPLVDGKKVATPIVIAVLTSVDAASRPPGYGRFGVTEKQKLGVDARWADVAAPLLGHAAGDVVEAAVNVLLDLPPRVEWRDAVEESKKALEKGMCSTGGADALLEAIAALSPAPAAPKESAKKRSKKPAASSGPLPAEPPCKAPKVTLPKSVPVAKLAKELDAMLASAKLTKHRALLVQPALHVFPKRVDEKKIALGASKVGGLPDLPAGAAWPTNDGCPMGFVAQLRLEDLAKHGEKRLPGKGLLYFFVHDEPFADGHLAKACIFHASDTKKLTRTPLPADFQMHRDGKPMRKAYCACELTFVPTLTLPSASNAALTKHLSKKEAGAFEESVQLDHPVVSQVLGYRNHGYDAENPATSQLLFRMTSDAQADMEWGDVDCLDFYIPQKDLAKGVFTKAYPYVGD